MTPTRLSVLLRRRAVLAYTPAAAHTTGVRRVRERLCALYAPLAGAPCSEAYDQVLGADEPVHGPFHAAAEGRIETQVRSLFVIVSQRLPTLRFGFVRLVVIAVVATPRPRAVRVERQDGLDWVAHARRRLECRIFGIVLLQRSATIHVVVHLCRQQHARALLRRGWHAHPAVCPAASVLQVALELVEAALERVNGARDGPRDMRPTYGACDIDGLAFFDLQRMCHLAERTVNVLCLFLCEVPDGQAERPHEVLAKL